MQLFFADQVVEKAAEKAMAKQEDTLHWQFLLDEDRWESRTNTADLLDSGGSISEDVVGRGHTSRLWVLVLAAVFMAGSVSVIWLWRDAQAGLDIVQDELQSIIDLESLATEQGDPRMMALLLDEYADASWRNQMMVRFFPHAEESKRQIAVRINDFELKEGRALVKVIVGDHRLAVPYQETRVYRETNTGWIRTAPDVDFWGGWESQESTYFFFRHRQRDRDAVTAAATQLDTLYKEVYRSIGMPIDLDSDKIRVEVRIGGPISQSNTRSAGGDLLAVLSPELLPRPLGLSADRALVESVALQVINLAVWDRMERMPEDWQALRSGMRLWLFWQIDGLFAQSRSDVVRWLYEESIARRGRGETLRPENYAAICQSFWLWQIRPYEVGIPLTCEQTEGQRLIPVRMALALRHLPMPNLAPEFRSSWTRLNSGRAVAVATLFDYVEETYGPAAVPELLTQTKAFGSWQQLIPDVLDVRPEEFEEGWLAHVRNLAGIQ